MQPVFFLKVLYILLWETSEVQYYYAQSLPGNSIFNNMFKTIETIICTVLLKVLSDYQIDLKSYFLD